MYSSPDGILPFLKCIFCQVLPSSPASSLKQNYHQHHIRSGPWLVPRVEVPQLLQVTCCIKLIEKLLSQPIWPLAKISSLPAQWGQFVRELPTHFLLKSISCHCLSSPSRQLPQGFPSTCLKSSRSVLAKSTDLGLVLTFPAFLSGRQII